MVSLKNNQFILMILSPILLLAPHFTPGMTCLDYYTNSSKDNKLREISLYQKYSQLQNEQQEFNSLYLLTEFLNKELLGIEADYNVIKSRIQLYGSDEQLKMAISRAQSTTENILKKIPSLKKAIAQTAEDKNISEETNSSINKCREDLKICRAALALSLRESNEFFKFIDPLLNAIEKQKWELKNLQKNLSEKITKSLEEADLSSQIIEQRILRISSLQKVILSFKTELSQNIDTAISLKNMTLPQLESLLRSLELENSEITLSDISQLSKSFNPIKDRSAESLEFLTESGKEFLSFLQKYNSSAFTPALSEKFRQIFLKDPKNNEFMRISLADAKKILTIIINSNISLTTNPAEHFSFEFSYYEFFATNRNRYSAYHLLYAGSIHKKYYPFDDYIKNFIIPQINGTVESILLLFKLLDVTYTSSKQPIVEQYFRFAHELLVEQKSQLEKRIEQKKTLSSKLKSLFTPKDEKSKEAEVQITFLDTLITYLEDLKNFHLNNIQSALNQNKKPVFIFEEMQIPVKIISKSMDGTNENP